MDPKIAFARVAKSNSPGPLGLASSVGGRQHRPWFKVAAADDRDGRCARHPLQCCAISAGCSEGIQRAAESNRTPHLRRMRVAAEQVSEPVARQPQHPVAGVVAQEAVGGDLDERAEFQQPPESVDEVNREMPLGVRDHRSPATRAQSLDRMLNSRVERSRRRLEQHPAPTAAERDRVQLAVVERIDKRCGQLAAGQDPGRATGGCDAGTKLGQPAWQRADLDPVILADVGGGADRLDSVCLRLSRHLDGVSEVAGAVVQARQDVAVEIDGDVNATIIAARLRGVRPSTRTAPPVARITDAIGTRVQS